MPAPQTNKWQRIKNWRKKVYLSKLSPGQKHVAITLSIYMDKDLHAFPSQETLSKMTSYNVKTVRLHLKKLEMFGWIQRDPGAGHARGWRKNHYWGFVPASENKEREEIKKLNLGNHETVRRGEIIS